MPKITFPSLNRDFLVKFNFCNFQLSFPAENEKKNSHFWKLKFWKKCKILTFQKSCLKSFWWCFSANPLVWGYFGCVLWACKPQNTFFGTKRPIFAKIFQDSKFSSKMLFFAWKTCIFDFWGKNTPQDASKCISGLGNRKNIPETIWN